MSFLILAELSTPISPPVACSHGQANATADRGQNGGPLRAAMWRKLRQGGLRSRYRLRKQTVEPVFGVIKQRIRF